MSGTLQASVVKDSASATNNLALDASGNVTVGNNLTVTGTGVLNIGSGQVYKDSSGNVGIGTSSTLGYRVAIVGSTASSVPLYLNTDAANSYVYSPNPMYVGSTGAYALNFVTNNAVRATIDSSGNLLVGTTSVIANGKINSVFDQSSASGLGIKNSNATATGYMIAFYNSGGTYQGSISQTNSTTINYNTSSDYRLKENVAPMTTGLSTIGALKPVTYDWIGDKSKGEGFIAHELQSVIPHAVTGEKDAVDADGKPQYQGVDYSKIVVHLVAALQELKATVDAQAAEITALKSKIGA